MSFLQFGGGGLGRGRLWRQSPWSNGPGYAKPWLCDTMGKEADIWNSLPPVNADWRPPEPQSTTSKKDEPHRAI